eukprot:GHVQ01029751.1.p2 GENE.GHVQ01029751.1~~GHVQ01029751.1.p2  ORF type:complete len:175 (-),score=22.04 GHVQ01029751.1:581-1105(-)
MCVHACVHVLCIFLCTFGCVHALLCACACVVVCMHVWMCVYVKFFVYNTHSHICIGCVDLATTHTHTHTQRREWWCVMSRSAREKLYTQRHDGSHQNQHTDITKHPPNPFSRHTGVVTESINESPSNPNKASYECPQRMGESTKNKHNTECWIKLQCVLMSSLDAVKHVTICIS